MKLTDTATMLSSLVRVVGRRLCNKVKSRARISIETFLTVRLRFLVKGENGPFATRQRKTLNFGRGRMLHGGLVKLVESDVDESTMLSHVIFKLKSADKYSTRHISPWPGLSKEKYSVDN